MGYGVRSIEFMIRTAKRLEQECADLAEQKARLLEIDATGVLATPANSRYNELVVEAGRMSILNGGRQVNISYKPTPSVHLS